MSGAPSEPAQGVRGPDMERLFEFASSTWAMRLRRAMETPEPGCLGGYKELVEVGRGGQGEVYRAVQPGTGRVVAIKRIAGLGLSPDHRLLERFTREVEALTRLSHPNVVSVFALEVIDGHSLLVMEYVGGVSIDVWADARWDAGGEPLKAVLQVFAEVCEGVTHAHQRGVVHRDLKPSNILVTREVTPKVLDFGIARILSEGAAEKGDAAWTVTGFAGTPAYAAPELLAPGRRSIDTRTDVYSLGVLLLRMLGGAEIIPTSSTTASGWQPPVVSASSLARARPDLPRECCWIISTCTDPEPERRYRSVDALRDDVLAMMAGRAIAAAPPSSLYQLKKVAFRHRWAFLGAACVVALLASATMWSLWSARRAREAGAIAAREAAKQRQVSELMRDMLSASAASRGARPDVTVREVVEAAAARHFPEPGRRTSTLDADVEATLRASIGETFLGIGRFDQAAVHLRIAAELQRELEGPMGGGYLATMTLLGRALRSEGKLAEAESVLRMIVDARRTRGNAEDVAPLAEALSSLGICLRWQDRTGEAEQCYREAMSLFEQVQGPDGQGVAMMSLNIAILLSRNGEHARAEPLARRGVAILEQAFPGGTPDSSSAVNTLGNILWAGGKLEEGEQQLRRSIAIDRAISPSPEIGLANKLGGLAQRYAGQSRFAEAAVLQAEAMGVIEHLNGRRNAAALAVRAKTAEFLRCAGALAEAEAVCRDCDVVPLSPDMPADMAPDMAESAARVRRELGEVLLARGRPDQAEVEFCGAWEVQNSVPAISREARLQLASRIEAMYAEHGDTLGRPEQAAAWRAMVEQLSAKTTSPATQ